MRLYTSLRGALTYAERCAFWRQIKRSERAFRNADTWTHAFARIGQYVWIALGVAFLACTYYSQPLSCAIRVTGAIGATWLLLLYANRDRIIGRFPRVVEFLVRMKAVLFITADDQNEIYWVFKLKTSVIGWFGAIAFGTLATAIHLARKGMLSLKSLIVLGSVFVVFAAVVYVVLCTVPICKRIRSGDISSAQCKRIMSAAAFDYLTSLSWLIIAVVLIRVVAKIMAFGMLAYETDALEWAYKAVFYVVSAAVVLTSAFLMMDIVVPVAYRDGWRSVAWYLVVNTLIACLFLFRVDVILVLCGMIAYSTVWNVVTSVKSRTSRIWAIGFGCGFATAAVSLVAGFVFSWIDALSINVFAVFFGILMTVLIDNLLGSWLHEALEIVEALPKTNVGSH